MSNLNYGTFKEFAVVLLIYGPLTVLKSLGAPKGILPKKLCEE